MERNAIRGVLGLLAVILVPSYLIAQDSTAKKSNQFQEKTKAPPGTAALSDDGALVTLRRDVQFKGPNPYFDVRGFGVRPTVLGAVISGSCTMSAGSPRIRLDRVLSLLNGDGFTCTKAGPAPKMNTPTAPTVTSMGPRMLTNIGQTVANKLGSTPYAYRVVAVDSGHGMTAASPIGQTTTGAATLGLQSVKIASWTRTDNPGGQDSTVSVTTATNHALVAGMAVGIISDSGILGSYQVASVPDSAHFTYLTGQRVANGAPAGNAASNGSVIYYLGNLITWRPVIGAVKYLIYRGSALIGVSMPETTIGSLASDPLHDSFEDYGTTITTLPNPPPWAPSSPPVAATNDDLTTTIVSGAGTSTLTLAEPAANAVSGTLATLDNTPNLLTAVASVCNGQGGTLYFPESTGNFPSYQFYSMPVLSCHAGVFSVLQAGTINAQDTFQIASGVIWQGGPLNPHAGVQFGWSKYPVVRTSTAYPMIWQSGSNGVLDIRNVTFTHDAANAGVIFVKDAGGIPAGIVRDVIFATALGANDYTSQLFVWRNNSAGGANIVFQNINLIAGPSSGGATPLWQATQGGGPFTFKNIFLNKRGIYIGGSFQATFENIYEQAAQMPKITLYNGVAGHVPAYITYFNAVEDTTLAPIIAYANGPGFITGNITIDSDPGVPGSVPVSGPGSVSVTYKNYGSSSHNFGQNINTVEFPISAVFEDGINSLSPINSYQMRTSMSHRVNNASQYFVSSAAQAAPTCAVSSGGTAGLGSYTFQVAPVFPVGSSLGQGTLSPASAACATTKGRQTITIRWHAVPGAVGYDLYKNGFSFQCNSPWAQGGSTTSYVWNGFPVGCGGQAPTRDGTGPTNISSTSVNTAALRLTNAFTTTIQPNSLTANRTVTVPDTNGTLTVTIATGTAALPTSSIASAACSSAVTVAANGVLTTDVITATFNADPTSIAGYTPSPGGSLYIVSYPTAGNVNFKVCNNTANPVTPGAANLNWNVKR